ncbi:MAG: hypothetical protein GXN99_01250 [Candidatus Nanohaloarchaeota archaeon]|nr:hypothetical protein [Candidatus Nanohaloarchaeota archaeon]
MDIKKALESYAEMFEDAFKKAEAFNIKSNRYKGAVFYGMGASAIAPLILSKWFEKVKVINSHRYDGRIEKNVFKIAVSYSGNTEEVLVNVKKYGVDFVVSSGGKLGEVKPSYFYEVPKNIPPRAAFPYLFVGSLTALRVAGIINKQTFSSIKQEVLSFDCRDVQNKAQNLANFLSEKEFAYVLSDEEDRYLAYRLKTQLNENAKMFAFHEVLPEANHNSLMALEDDIVKKKAGFVFVNSLDGFVRFSQEYWKKQVGDYEEIEAPSSTFKRFIYLLCLGDWASYYLSELREVDATETSVIEGLKNERRNI